MRSTPLAWKMRPISRADSTTRAVRATRERWYSANALPKTSFVTRSASPSVTDAGGDLDAAGGLRAFEQRAVHVGAVDHGIGVAEPLAKGGPGRDSPTWYSSTASCITMKSV